MIQNSSINQAPLFIMTGAFFIGPAYLNALRLLVIPLAFIEGL